MKKYKIGPYNTLERLLFLITQKALLLAEMSSSAIFRCGFLWRKEVRFDIVLITWRRRSVFAIFGLSSIKTTQENLSKNFLARKKTFLPTPDQKFEVDRRFSAFFIRPRNREKSFHSGTICQNCYESLLWKFVKCIELFTYSHLFTFVKELSTVKFSRNFYWDTSRHTIKIPRCWQWSIRFWSGSSPSFGKKKWNWHLSDYSMLERLLL